MCAFASHAGDCHTSRFNDQGGDSCKCPDFLSAEAGSTRSFAIPGASCRGGRFGFKVKGYCGQASGVAERYSVVGVEVCTDAGRESVALLLEICAGGLAAQVCRSKQQYIFTKCKIFSESIYHIILGHAIKISVVVKAFSTEKRRGQQRIYAVRRCENKRAARRPAGIRPADWRFNTITTRRKSCSNI